MVGSRPHIPFFLLHRRPPPPSSTLPLPGLLPGAYHLLLNHTPTTAEDPAADIGTVALDV
jgi:hypothetical protein